MHEFMHTSLFAILVMNESVRDCIFIFVMRVQGQMHESLFFIFEWKYMEECTRF